MTTAALPESLPAAFSYTAARRSGLSDRRLRDLQSDGLIQALSRGLYLRQDAPPADLDLLEIAARAPDATLCLRSALAHHDLIDDIPPEIDLALPRGRRHPKTAAPARWHTFDPQTFQIGRSTLQLAGQLSIGLYSPERCLIDAFRLRHQEGPELAHQALKAWLRRRDAPPATLLRMAKDFPKAEPALRLALEILL